MLLAGANLTTQPAYGSATVSGQLKHTWDAATSDVRAPQTADGSSRIASTWYETAGFDVDVNVTDGQTHPLSLYALDWDHRGRAETFTLTDADSGATLDTESAADFDAGKYLVWNVSGHVHVHIARTAGDNAVLAGVFFGTNAPPAPSNVQAVAADGQVALSWDPVATATGYNVYRSEAGGTPLQIASGLTKPAYVDNAAVNGTAYTYTVTAANAGGASSASSSQSATPGGTWVTVDASELPDVTDANVKSFVDGNGGTILPAGTYRVVYVDGQMTYSGPQFTNQGYRVNAFPGGTAPTGDYGFKIVGADQPDAAGGDLHAPGTSTEGQTPQEEAGVPFSHAAGGIGVYLADAIYEDNVAYASGGPSYRLERLLTLNSLTATDLRAPANNVIASDKMVAQLYVAEDDASGSATVSLSDDYTPVRADTGTQILYSVEGAAAFPASGSFNTDPSIVLTAENGNYDFLVTVWLDANSDGEYDSSEQSRKVDIHLYTVELQFNDSADTSDDIVRLTTPAFGNDIPADQPVLDAGVRVLGSPPPGLMVAFDSPGNKVAFGTAAPSTMPGTPPSTPIATQAGTAPFSLTVGGGRLHLPIIGVDKSTHVGDGSVRVVVSGGTAAIGLVLARKGVTVFWFDQATIDVVPDAPYTTQGDFYAAAAGPNKRHAVDIAAQASIEPAGLNPTAPQLANLRIGVVQNVVSESAGDVYNTPQMVWNTNYPNNGGPIQAGTQVNIPSMIYLPSLLDLNAATFPLPDAYFGENPVPLPLFSREPEALGIPGNLLGGGSAICYDSPSLPLPLTQLPAGVRGPALPIFDGAGRYVGKARYLHRLKSLRKLNFTDWCVVVDISAGAHVVAALAQNEWQVDLDSSVGNQTATAGQSHIPNTIPVLSGAPANSFSRVAGGLTAYGPGVVQVTK